MRQSDVVLKRKSKFTLLDFRFQINDRKLTKFWKYFLTSISWKKKISYVPSVLNSAVNCTVLPIGIWQGIWLQLDTLTDIRSKVEPSIRKRIGWVVYIITWMRLEFDNRQRISQKQTNRKNTNVNRGTYTKVWTSLILLRAIKRKSASLTSID